MDAHRVVLHEDGWEGGFSRDPLKNESIRQGVWILLMRLLKRESERIVGRENDHVWVCAV